MSDKNSVEPFKEEIEAIAHQIWETEGKAQEHWCRAKEQLRRTGSTDVQMEHRNFL